MKRMKFRDALRCAHRGSLAAFAVLTAAGVATAQTSVLTQHYDNTRSGANINETILTPANVNSALFGKLFTLPLDANVNSQILYVPNLTLKGTGNTAVDGTTHNVVFAYTSSNGDNSACSLTAYDADAQGTALWHTTLPASARWTTAAPVIDPATNLIYVITKTPNDSGSTYLRVYDIASGKEKVGSPLLIDGNLVHVPGTGDGSSGGVVKFDTTHANCRPSLLLVNGVVYIGFAHNSDSFPYHGWVLGFQYDTAQSKLVNTAVFCTNPNGGADGIWQAGKGLMADAAGNIYFTVGNGTFDANTKGISATTSYGMCIVKVGTPNLNVLDYFAPRDELSRSNSDSDVGNVGALMIPNTSRVFFGGTKFGSSFLVDSNNLGKFNATTDQVIQRIDNFSSDNSQNPVAWENSATIKYVYQWGAGNNILQWRYDTTLGKFTTATSPYKQAGANAGGELCVTSNGQTNGLLWAIGKNSIVYALDATDVSKTPLWTSTANSSRDSLPSIGKWQFPVVVNGKAYIPTGGASIAVYGLLPVSVSGTLALQGATGTVPAQNFTFQFRPVNGGATITKTASVGANGAFSFAGIPANKYTLWVKGGFYLASAVPLDATNGAVTTLAVALDPGDANGDNMADVLDFGALVNAYGAVSGAAGSTYDPAVDFNYDGSVDVLDFGFLVNVYGQSGAL